MTDHHDSKTDDELPQATQPKRRGPAPKYANQAERQRAYRERLKERGLREVRHIVRDVRDTEAPLESDIIDLSEVRTKPPKKEGQ